MAEVFKAKLVAAAGTEKVLCIKRILPSLSCNQEFISLFVKEAKIALSLTHGNITQVFDFGEVDGVYYLAMEFISGHNLYDVLGRMQEMDRLLELPAALYIAAEVCKGLQYAHSFTDVTGQTNAVVHRDVTPHNILISYNGEVKLTDFGIALAATKASTDDEVVVRGKARYLSPEQANGHPGEPRSDIFSLGTVIYEMLTGYCPFEADGERETLEQIRTLEVAPPTKYNEQVGEELAAVVLQAMAKSPAKRCSSAGDLQVALTQILHRSWPDYTAGSLAETIKELFAWEIAQIEGAVDGDSPRDHLLFQLSRAGVKVDPEKTSTAELLELGTVDIAGVSRSGRGSRPRWRVPLGIGGGIALLAVALALLLVLPAGNERPEMTTDKGPWPPPSAHHRTEHLTPPSPKPAEEAGPPPARPPAKLVPPARGRAVAFLNCNSWPWSVVYINGRRLRGNTPLYRVRVRPGRNRVRFVNPELGMSKEVTVSVSAGHIKTVAVSLQ